MNNPDVTIGSGVTIWPSVTEGPGVTTYTGTSAGGIGLPDLALITTGVLLLMTGGGLQLV